jgi:hypothetical protein
MDEGQLLSRWRSVGEAHQEVDRHHDRLTDAGG